MTRHVNVSSRRATESDAAALAEVGAALFRQTYAGSISAAEIDRHVSADFSTARQAGELRDPSIVSFLVERGSSTVGFAQLRLRELRDDAAGPAEIELWRIYLDRSLHGMGVGRRLLATLGEAAQERGATAMWLAVWEKNPRAIAFYEKHGFDRAATQTFQVGDEVQNDLVLRRPLP